MKLHKKIPYGVSDFEKLIQQNCYFMDNTHYIEQLESMGESYLFFFRPRRFGKSLFLSMLWYYYDLRYKDKLESLFSELYIGKHLTPLASQYAVLFFNFSNINTDNPTSAYQDFSQEVQVNVKDFIKVYSLISEDEKGKILKQKAPNAMMRAFFKTYKNKGIKIIALFCF
jgi:hypothetical protein